MLNVEMVVQVFGGLVQKLVVSARFHHQVGGQDIFRGAGCPDVKVMQALHPGKTGQIVENCFRINPTRNPGHAQMQRILEQPPAGGKDEDDDDE